MTIGDNLRALRADSGMTQEQVAEQLGVTRQTLSSYESGRTRPDIDMLVRLCQVYDTDLDGIVYGQARVLKDLRRVRRTAVALLALSILALLHRPLGRLLRLAARSAVGLAVLALFSQVGQFIGVSLGVNLVNALILGVLGVPGFGLLLMLQWVLR